MELIVKFSGYTAGYVPFDDLTLKSSRDSRLGIYGVTKLCNILYSHELHRRFKQSRQHYNKCSITLHPVRISRCALTALNARYRREALVTKS